MPEELPVEIGDEAVYCEDDFSYRVEVVREEFDRNMQKYRLKVLKVLRESKLVKMHEIGEEFDCSRNVRYSEYPGQWTLERLTS